MFTQARGRNAMFWQSPKTRKTARPNVWLPTARPAGLAGLQIVVDSHERVPVPVRQPAGGHCAAGPAAGDYGIVLAGRLVAAVKCKSLPDLVSSLTSGKLGYQLACLPRAAVVGEDGTRTCSSWNGYVRRPWPTGWPSWRCAGLAYDPTWLKLVRTFGTAGLWI